MRRATLWLTSTFVLESLLRSSRLVAGNRYAAHPELGISRLGKFKDMYIYTYIYI